MKKVGKVGIIAEYNPFHNGHIYQLKEARKRFPNTKIIVIMSGKYVQRGELAIASFRQRKKYALKYGADKVIKLSFKYATQAAHIFAEGAVKTANKLGINKLFFGSESNNPETLMLIAKTIFKKESIYNNYLKFYLKQGWSFPAAAAKSLNKLTGKAVDLPNDILGLEYCKAIVKNHLPIKVYTLERTISFHAVTPCHKYASASYLRKRIYMCKNVASYTPMMITKFHRIEDYYSKFQKIVRKMPAQKLAKIKLISEGMENLFKKHIEAPTYDDFVNKTNSKRYTSSRIKRVMLYVLLKIWK